jgi:hypothetical protein
MKTPSPRNEGPGGPTLAALRAESERLRAQSRQVADRSEQTSRRSAELVRRSQALINPLEGGAAREPTRRRPTAG